MIDDNQEETKSGTASSNMKTELYDHLLLDYGLQQQINMAMEEMGELISEINRYRRERTDINKVAEEIADVLITLEQIVRAYDINELVRAHKSKKITKAYHKYISSGMPKPL